MVPVTGHNGKGSVASLGAAVLTSAGLLGGADSSPLIDTVRGRLTIDGQLISEEAFADLLADVERYAAVAPERPSYFELLTAAAFLWVSSAAAQVVCEPLVGRGDPRLHRLPRATRGGLRKE